MAWVALPGTVRHATHDCTRFTNDDLRSACKEVIELRQELAAAAEYDRLSHRSEELRVQLAGFDIAAAQDPMPRAFEKAFGRTVNMDGKDGIALMAMLILRLVSAVGPFGVDMLRRRSNGAQPSSPPASCCMRLTMDSNCAAISPQDWVAAIRALVMRPPHPMSAAVPASYGAVIPSTPVE